MWSDFCNGNPMSYMECNNAINDYRLIRAGDGEHRFNPQIAHSLHRISKAFLQENVKEGGRFLAHTSIIEHLFDVMIDDLMTKLEKDGYLKIVRGEDGERELVSIAEIEDKACRKLVEDVKKLEKVKENG